MAAWAMGRIGGLEAEKRLQGLLPEADSQVEQEIKGALDRFNILEPPNATLGK